MNKNIEKLAIAAGYDIKKLNAYENFDHERFARLIVQAFTSVCDQAAEGNARVSYQLAETKDVTSACVSKGAQIQAEKLSASIKTLFGIEE